MRLCYRQNFPSLGLAFWWALQTVTTVGYGDVVPTTDVGRVVGSIEMVLGISFVALLIAGVTSAVLLREEARAETIERTRKQRDVQTLNDVLTQIQEAIAGLDKQLDNLESRGGAS
jgi:voltage-gated potassium channel Kch